MTIQKIHLAYFSATGTTAKIVSAIESGLNIKETSTINLAARNQKAITIPNDELVVFGIPVFSGRIPELARKGIELIRGNNTPAIIVCVYGNRDFDDALIELKDLVENNGFYLLSAGAFIAQHSIFPKVAPGRPDSSDLIQAKEFGANSLKAISNEPPKSPLKVRGDHHYRATKPIPLTPKTNSTCNSCGLCTKQCPVQAIDTNNPKKIDKSRCVSCARCISICPNHSKKFGGLLYWAVSRKFTKANAQRKESYLVYR